VTESGFGADLGFEKFIDIKCRASGLTPSAAMIVATIRACKLHGGDYNVKAGRPLPKELLRENVGAVERGGANLAHMIGIVKRAGLPAVVAINRFPDDTDREIEAVRLAAKQAGAAGVELIEAYARGGEGAVDIARAVAAACEIPSAPRPFYDVKKPIREKIETIARDVYGADGVDYSPRAVEEIDRYTRWGLAELPICMAKSQLSISHDPKLRGVPTGFRVPIQQVRASAGAGFLYPLLGDIMTMPGLPSEPASEHMDIDSDGNLIGLTK
jgi:formyltetrahydrofolate synthetase